MAEDGLLHTAELIKSAIPYADVRSKFILDLLVKLYELIACLRNFRTKDMAACGFENTYEKVDAETLLKKIRPSCNQKERAFVDKLLNIFQAKRIFEMYITYMQAMEGFDGFSDSNNNEDDTGNFMDNLSDIDLSTIVGNDDIDNSFYHINTDSDAINGETNSEDKIISDGVISSEREDNQDFSSNHDNSSLIESLKTMLSPEQRETFENLRILFETMSYDDNKNSESDKE